MKLEGTRALEEWTAEPSERLTPSRPPFELYQKVTRDLSMKPESPLLNRPRATSYPLPHDSGQYRSKINNPSTSRCKESLATFHRDKEDEVRNYDR